MLAEEARILYVAMTRARDALILVGTVKDLFKESQKWCKAYYSARLGAPGVCITKTTMSFGIG